MQQTTNATTTTTRNEKKLGNPCVEFIFVPVKVFSCIFLIKPDFLFRTNAQIFNDTRIRLNLKRKKKPRKIFLNFLSHPYHPPYHHDKGGTLLP